jgi:hypothetical protein
MSFIRLNNTKIYNFSSIKTISLNTSIITNKKYAEIEFKAKNAGGMMFFFGTDPDYEKFYEHNDPTSYKQLENFIAQTKALE